MRFILADIETIENTTFKRDKCFPTDYNAFKLHWEVVKGTVFSKYI